MDFNEAQQQLADINARYRQGEIPQEQYGAAINAIRVLDASNRWWQPSPSGQGWIYWDGTAWQPGTPPIPSYPSTPGTVQVPGQVQPSASQPGTRPDSPPRMMDTQQFMAMSKSMPLKKRPQIWWDTLSVLGGVAVAIIWFLYAGHSQRPGRF